MSKESPTNVSVCLPANDNDKDTTIKPPRKRGRKKESKLEILTLSPGGSGRQRRLVLTETLGDPEQNFDGDHQNDSGSKYYIDSSYLPCYDPSDESDTELDFDEDED